MTSATITLLIIAAAAAGAVAGFIVSRILDNKWMAELSDIYEEAEAELREDHRKQIRRLYACIARLEAQRANATSKQRQPAGFQTRAPKERWLLDLEDLNWGTGADNIDFDGDF